jgi:hypothetical protein
MAEKRRYSSFPQSLGTLVERATRPAGRKRGFAEIRLLSDWGLIVGEELAAYTIPQKISQSKNQPATLHVMVEPAWAMELQYMEPVVLERIAGFFGYRLISRIVIHQGPIPPRAAAPQLVPDTEPLPDTELFAGHEDGALKDALRRLGASIHNRSDTCNQAKDRQYEDV